MIDLFAYAFTYYKGRPQISASVSKNFFTTELIISDPVLYGKKTHVQR